MQQTNKKNPPASDNSFLEQLRSLSNNPPKSPKTPYHSPWGSQSSVESFTSFEKTTTLEQSERKETQKRAAYEYKQEFVVFSKQEQQTMKEIEAIRQELVLLVNTIKEVDFEVKKAVLEIPVNPGIYHVRFLERIRKLLKLVREKLEDSRCWLKLSTTRKRQKGYWGMYKKKGTSFGLSGERVVSTQTG